MLYFPIGIEMISGSHMLYYVLIQITLFSSLDTDEDVKFKVYQGFSGVHITFRFYQVFSGVPVKFRFYQIFGGVHVKFRFYRVFNGGSCNV